MKRKALFSAGGALLALLLVGAALMYSGSGNQQASAQRMEHLDRASAPTKGNPAAPVHIVEFFDPACGTCAEFYPLVKRIMADHPHDIWLSVRYAPFHPGSQDVVKALEASRKQGMFWPALETLLDNQAGWAQNHAAHIDLIWPYLARAGLDTDKLKADMQSPEIARAIEQDMQDANALEVTATPEYFVDGRSLPSFGQQQLIQLVSDELDKAHSPQ